MGSPNGAAMKQHSAGASGQQVQQQQQQQQLGPRGLIPRHEFVRLMEQALYRLGFAGVAQALEQASVGGWGACGAALLQPAVRSCCWRAYVRACVRACAPALLCIYAAVNTRRRASTHARATPTVQGIQMQPQQATQFQACLMAGDWGGALGLLPRLAPNEDVERDVR